MKSLLLLFATAALAAGPVDFGMDEVRAAMAARGIKPGLLRFATEIGTEAPETWRILPGRITGGDRRGLMYGLLEAAEQIRATGRMAPASGKPAMAMRGIRWFLHNEEMEKQWYYSREFWVDFFRMLARNRFNRFNLVFAHQTPYLAPPYPYWVAVEEHPEVRVPGLSDEQRQRNLDMLRFISQTAADYAVDFTLGIWEHNIQPGMKPSVTGLTRQNIGPYSYAALKKVLAACPSIRSVQMRTNSESGIPGDYQVEFYRDYVYRALREAGHLVTLDLRGWVMSNGMLDGAIGSGVPLRLSSKYWAEDLGRPYQPAETWPNYSYIDFLQKRPDGKRPYEFYWELWGLGSHRLLLWGDPDYVRRAAGTFTLSDSIGFEIDPPLAQKGFGNAPGTWGVFTGEASKDRVSWNHEFERYWMFYLLWGRLTYDPKTADRAWMSELQRRFGPASPDVMDAYKNASKVLNEIVAVHLADPNMYIWPEINPGGLIDAYKEVLPSDWRYVASIHEAVENRLEHKASARQTPAQTAAKLDAIAEKIDAAVARASAKLPGSKEWKSSESDFRVLAALARFHARRQIAAESLAIFDATADPAALKTARQAVEASVAIWEGLVRLTDGVYPARMAFGPDDVGHWKDKLPYVRHDLKLIEDRENVLAQFGRFDFGFDFGGPQPERKNASYRNDPYVLWNTLAPRFQPASSDTRYSEKSGYGWVSDRPRQDVAIERTPYAEVRATALEPKRLPSNVLYGDSIRGSGAQTFRVRTGEGEFDVFILKPDGAADRRTQAAVAGHIDVVFPEGDWQASGLVIRSVNPKPAPAAEPAFKAPVKPALQHFAQKAAPPGKPLVVSLRVWPQAGITTVRLHYRAVNQRMKFKTLEAAPARATFTIPGADINADHDLMYYFEVLHKQGGWFEPDPNLATPYYVVRIERLQAASEPPSFPRR